MKKILTLIAAALICGMANAQSWDVEIVDADPLRGNPSYTSSTYMDRGVGGVAYRSDLDGVIILCSEGIFDYDLRDRIEGVLVGYYKDGTLQDKETCTAKKGSSADILIIRAETGGRVKNWLENGGDVRVVAPRFSRADFDFTIPHK